MKFVFDLVEHFVGKGENAGYPLLVSSLPKISLKSPLSQGLLLFTTQSQFLTILGKSPLKTLGKGKNAGNQHFLLFPQCFLPYQREKSLFR